LGPTPKIANFPVKFPEIREFTVKTGSHMTAHTTTFARTWPGLWLPFRQIPACYSGKMVGFVPSARRF
jgi:hypothetical protein